MSDALQELAADARAGFRKGGLRPRPGTWFATPDGAAGCALAAAYRAHHPALPAAGAGSAVIDWAMAHYRLTRDHVWGVMAGFHAPDDHPKRPQPPAWWAGFEAGRAVREEVMG